MPENIEEKHSKRTWSQLEPTLDAGLWLQALRLTPRLGGVIKLFIYL